MRLIKTTTLELEEFIESQIPKYAILSHTWGNEEVTLQEWRNRKKWSSNISSREGYQKILDCCKRARRDCLDYVWVDTCCIDKTSSAELTESINSMFRWYSQAKVCYAYLIDFDVSASSFHDGAKDCRWFTRGWTLQELIAPSKVEFYDKNGQYQGGRDFKYETLAAITGIDADVLAGYESPYKYSVAIRMSWAASRQTTRPEDTAYCLLGLFDVSLPLIYGEGVGAFRRLQEAIMKSNNDLSILAWGMSPKIADTAAAAASASAFVVHRQSEDPQAQHQQLFATSPSDFAHSKNVCGLPLDHSNTEFMMTNKGLHVEANLFKGGHEGSQGYFLCLAWRNTIGRFGRYANANNIWLKLRKILTDIYTPDGLFEDGCFETAGCTGLMSFYILHQPQETYYIRRRRQVNDIHILEHDHIRLKKAIPEIKWNEASRIFYEPDEESTPLVYAARFEAQIPLQNSKMEFIIIFDNVTHGRSGGLLCSILDRKEYPRQSDWIFGDRGPGRDLLWCDLKFNMPEVMQLGNKLHVEVEGTKVDLGVGCKIGEMQQIRFDLTVKAQAT